MDREEGQQQAMEALSPLLPVTHARLDDSVALYFGKAILTRFAPSIATGRW